MPSPLPRPSRLVAAAFTSLVGLAFACGDSADKAEFGEADINGSPNGNGNGNGNGDPNNGGFGNDDPNDGADGSVGNVGDGGACAAQTANAERKPVYIYFLFDKSGSMGDGDHGDPEKKLYPVSKAFKSFLGSSRAEGIQAAMTLFPNTEANACNVSSYEKLDVALTALPNAKPFADALPNTSQLGDSGDGTPTLPALKGLLPTAKANADAHPEAKTVVVLITDGDPQKCDGNTVENIGKEVAKYKDAVPTYVIGVGKSLTKLNDIADKGGTEKAILIDVGDPSITEKQFADKIDEIRLKSLSCDLDIPAPPAGETLDFNKINVSYTPSDGPKKLLGYDAKCESGGWRFDDPSKPSKIVLCTSVCDAVKEDPKGTVGVEFGCARRTSGVN